MLKALFPLCGTEDSGQDTLKVLLPVSLVARLLDESSRAQLGESLQVDISKQVISGAGKALTCSLHWVQMAQGFDVRVGNEAVGVILRDELAGVMPVPQVAGRRSKPCQVAYDLNGMQVWRKGLIDLEDGAVAALSVDKRFDYLPAFAVVGCEDGWNLDSAVVIDLVPGPVQKRFMLSNEDHDALLALMNLPDAKAVSAKEVPALDLCLITEFGGDVLDFFASKNVAA